MLKQVPEKMEDEHVEYILNVADKNESLSIKIFEN